MTDSIPDQARAEIAPSGTIRAAMNFGNPVLVQKDPATGAPRGIAAALANELGRRLGAPVAFVPFETASAVADAVSGDRWDIAFLAIDPARAGAIGFTAPYVIIEGTYLVRSGSPLKAIDDFDRDGVRIAVGERTAYDLYLTRTITRATLVRAPSSAAALELFLRDGLEAAAGVRQPLATFARVNAGLRVIDGRFTTIRQAMAAPKERKAALAYLHGFVEDAKASGFVGHGLAESGQGEADVAPPGDG